MSQSKGFAGMFGNAVAKLTDIRPISEDIGMTNAGRMAGGKADRVSRKDRRQQVSKRPAKTRGQPVEDIEMKGTVPTGRGKFDPYNRTGRRATFTRDVVHGAKEPKEVVITGWAEGTEANLIPYLEEKSKTALVILAVQTVGPSLHIMVENIVIAKILQRLNGYAYENRQLSIYIIDDDPSLIEEGSGNSTVDVLRRCLSGRWNADTKYLNLTAMADDAILQDAGIKTPQKDDSNFVGSAFMKLAGEMFPDVITISFARNQLSKLKPFSMLAKFIPNVQHISFQQNNIANVNQLSLLSAGGKLSQLKELILTDNPFREALIEKDPTGEMYKSEVVKLFPNLQILDGQAIHINQQVQDLPIPCLGGFMDSDSSRSLVTGFIDTFFTCFDNQRTMCGLSYDQNAVFSLTTNLKLASTKTLPKKERVALKKSKAATWETFHHKATAAKDKGLQNISCGQMMIASVLPSLPTTRHNLNRKEMVVDAYKLNAIPGFANAIHLGIHGDFTSDHPVKQTYSFDRVLIVAPTTPTPTLGSSGCPYVILNDQLCVRDYTPLTPLPNPMQPTITATNQNNVKSAMISEVQKISGLKLEFATQCLEENNWDVTQAVAAFQRLQAAGSIPAEAYQC